MHEPPNGKLSPSIYLNSSIFGNSYTSYSLSATALNTSSYPLSPSRVTVIVFVMKTKRRSLLLVKLLVRY